MAKKYRILQSFTYKGKDGKSDRAITLGPGEDVPELDLNERARLLKQEYICEVSENGENIRYKKLLDLDDEQIENLMKKALDAKSKHLVMAELRAKAYSKDTLSKIYAIADQNPKIFDKSFLDFLEQKIAGEI